MGDANVIGFDTNIYYTDAATVKAIQRALAAKGAKENDKDLQVQPTGVLDAATKTAIKKYKTVYGGYGGSEDLEGISWNLIDGLKGYDAEVKTIWSRLKAADEARWAEEDRRRAQVQSSPAGGQDGRFLAATGMSTGAKIAIGVGAVGGVGLLVWLVRALARRR